MYKTYSDNDDISSLRNFLCILITFWSSQGNLSSKKSRKTEESAKKKNVSRFGANVTRFGALKNQAFDIGENVSRWQKRDTIMETLIWVVCYTRQKCVTIYLNRATILGAAVAYLS